jgi:hypothetical protein
MRFPDRVHYENEFHFHNRSGDMPILLLFLVLMPSQLRAFTSPDSEGSSVTGAYGANTPAHNQSGPIQDNSFLVEEAYNQEDGVVQHISYMQRSFATGEWVYTQTDEWPARTIKHQFSLTMSAAHSSAASGVGLSDTAINYRYQLRGDGEARLAIAPRFTLLLPSGNFRLGRGAGGLGVQTNLPISVQHTRRLVTHWNAGATWMPHARNVLGAQAQAWNFNLGQSLVWLASSRVNGLLETIWTSTNAVTGVNTTTRREDMYLSPGIRWAHNFSSGLQIVPGIGFPMGIGPSARQKSVIFYLSFEHSWGVAHSR